MILSSGEGVAVANEHLYACPETHAALRGDGNELRGGDRPYPIQNGIPILLRIPVSADSTSADPDDAKRLVRLNELAREKGWQAALSDVFGEKSGHREYVTSPMRTAFLDLLPLKEDATVFEIGPGLGQFSPSIASRVQQLYALDVDPGQSEFSAIRCEQEGVTNASFACGGDDCRLPYLDDSFDVVIANLVFEWCGANNKHESPQTCQRRLLDEFHRILKPGGVLWLSTKNRYALRALFGKRDEHVFGMRFGNALPRPIMNLMLRLRGKGHPDGRLYSHSRLRKMLGDSGLDPVQSFWAAPEMRYPTRFVPTDSISVRAARKDATLVQGESRLTRLLMPRLPAALVKYFTPGLAFIARKPE